MSSIHLIKAMGELEGELVVQGVKEQMAAGVSAIDILAQLQKGMEQVGKLYEDGEYSVKVLIGGGPCDENIAKYCDADGYCKNAYDAVELSKKYI